MAKKRVVVRRCDICTAIGSRFSLASTQRFARTSIGDIRIDLCSEHLTYFEELERGRQTGMAVLTTQAACDNMAVVGCRHRQGHS